MGGAAGGFPLVAVAGPTGSGKSDLALDIALEFSGEIVNCDSLQIYRYFDIGTAKVPIAERRGVPHHLIDVAEPGDLFTAGDYARHGRQVLREVAARGRLPVIVGGTGFYFRALFEGLFAGPGRDPDLRARLLARQERRPGSPHRLLRRFDPSAARRIHPNDVNKTVRALEVCLLARRPITEMFAQGSEPLQGFRTLKIGLNPPREKLYERINFRAQRMFESGLVDEVRRILDRGVPENCNPFESLGYRQALAVVRGRMTTEEAIESTRQATRRYAKRQWTWFRKEPDIEWMDGFGDDATVQKAVRERVAGHFTKITKNS